MEDIDILIEDYQRRLSTINENLKNYGDPAHDKYVSRLKVKASCYRTFLAELNGIKYGKTNNIQSNS